MHRFGIVPVVPAGPDSIARMWAAVLSAIGGGALLAAQAGRSVVIGERLIRREGGAVIVDIDIGLRRMMLVVFVVIFVVVLMMRSR
jgi:hypothetical protein